MVYLGEDGLSVGARLCCVSGVELRCKGSGKQTDFYILGLRRQFCADIYKLGQAFLPDKNVVGLIDGRIFAFWDSDVFVSVNQRAKTLIYMCDSFFVAYQGNNLDRLYSYYGSEEKLKRHSL